MRNGTALGLILILGAGLQAEAAVPKNALGAIAVSPDGAMVVAAGDNRALYVVDPASLAVKDRIYLGVNPLTAAFSADGATLVVYDTDDMLHFYGTSDWKEKAAAIEASVIAFAPGADVVATLGRASGSGDATATAFAVYALADGSKKLETAVKGRAEVIAAAADGSAYTILLDRAEDASEPKEKPGADLKGAAKTEFELKNDGYTSTVVTLDASGVETARAKTWYSPTDDVEGAMSGGSAYFVGYSNKGLKVDAAGGGSYFQVPTSYLYGQANSADGAKIAAGGLRDGTVYGYADGAGVAHKIDTVPGWPEYFKSYAFAPDGSIYAGTTSYRLIHIGADGSVLAAQPVF